MDDPVQFHSFPVAGIDPMSAATDRSFPRHTHDQYGIGIVDAGTHASWSDQGHVEARPGQFICVNPGEVHDGRAIRSQSRSWRIFYFEPYVISELRADIYDGTSTTFEFSAPVFGDDDLRALFDTAFAHAKINGHSRNAMACEAAILQLVARLGLHASNVRRTFSGPTGSVARTVSLIDVDPAAPLTLTGLANEAGLSRYQLIRAFAREFGLAPHAYIRQRRLALARRLIRKRHALADVATMAGFCDQSHLNRCFLQHFGVTPGRYAANTV